MALLFPRSNCIWAIIENLYLSFDTVVSAYQIYLCHVFLTYALYVDRDKIFQKFRYYQSRCTTVVYGCSDSDSLKNFYSYNFLLYGQILSMLK